MHQDQFIRCQRATGLSDAEWAHCLGLTGRTRAVREFKAGKRQISGPVARLALVLAGCWPYFDSEPALWRYAHTELDELAVECLVSGLPRL